MTWNTKNSFWHRLDELPTYTWGSGTPIQRTSEEEKEYQECQEALQEFLQETYNDPVERQDELENWDWDKK